MSVYLYIYLACKASSRVLGTSHIDKHDSVKYGRNITSRSATKEGLLLILERFKGVGGIYRVR